MAVEDCVLTWSISELFLWRYRLCSAPPPAVTIETHECNSELGLDWWRELFLEGNALFSSSAPPFITRSLFLFCFDVATSGLVWSSAADVQ